MTSIPAPSPEPPNPVALVAAIGILAGAVITLVTVFEIVHWSAGQTAFVTAEVAAVAGFLTAVARHFKPDTKQEHVAVAATFTAMVAATLALGTGFGWWTMTEQETAALLGVITGLIGVGSAMFARDRVHADKTPSKSG
jgi:hypothetical protein